MPINGLVVMKPTSVAKTGASSTATINADGSVTFGSCETLSLNGVFSADYDNYMIAVRHLSGVNGSFNIRLRNAGADATATNYTFQEIEADNTTITGARVTSSSIASIGSVSATQRSGTNLFLYGPYLAQPTAGRGVNTSGAANAYLTDRAFTHSLSTSYDGITMIPDSTNFTGLVTVFGFNQ